MIKPEVLEVESDTLPNAFRLVSDECCSKYKYLDAPLKARIEFYGVRMLLSCEDMSTDHIQRRLVYTFLVTFEGRE